MKRYLRNISHVAQKFSALRISVYAGNAAFFLLLSLFPGIMAIISALRYLPATVSDLETFLAKLTPTPLHGVLRSFFVQISSGSITLVSISALGALWSVSRCMRSVMHGLDAAYFVTQHRPLLKRWAISLCSAVLLLVCILLTLLLQVFGNSLYLTAAERDLPGRVFFLPLLRLRWPLVLGFLTLVFCLLYTILPGRRQKFIQNVPGAALATAGWQLFSLLYGIYVENFSNYSNLYGSLTAIVITLLWVYFCMNLLFCGGLFNAILARYDHPFRDLWKELSQ